MTSHAADAHSPDAHHAHPPYVKIYVVLVVLFLISVMGPEVADWVKSGHDGSEANMAARGHVAMLLVLFTAFGIAIVKAVLVGGYFMHLKFEPAFARMMLFGMMAFLLVFFAGVAPDVMKLEGANWKHNEIKPNLPSLHEGAEHAAPAGEHGEAAAPVAHH